MVLYEMYAAQLPFVDNLKGVINIYYYYSTVLRGLIEDHSLIYTRVVFLSDWNVPCITLNRICVTLDRKQQQII